MRVSDEAGQNAAPNAARDRAAERLHPAIAQPNAPTRQMALEPPHLRKLREILVVGHPLVAANHDFGPR